MFGEDKEKQIRARESSSLGENFNVSVEPMGHELCSSRRHSGGEY
jgi:hypothetical protein